MSRRRGMINVAAVEASRNALATAGAAVANGIASFLPGIWPNHQYTDSTPDGVFLETQVEVDAPHHPGDTMNLPYWEVNGDPYGFADTEAAKVDGLAAYLFDKKSLEWWADHLAFTAGQIFREFGTRADREFEGGKFPRDQWKAGSYDPEQWELGRFITASKALALIEKLDEINNENVILPSGHNWLIAKNVQGVTLLSMETDSAITTMPQLLSDMISDWQDFPAYARLVGISDETPRWTAAKLGFASALARMQAIMIELATGDFASEFFDECVTVWRTGSQTVRRDQYE